MSDQYAESTEQQDREEKARRLAAVGAKVRNNAHLKTMLLNIEAKERKSVYNCLVPHLTFKPLSYRALMRLSWRVN